MGLIYQLHQAGSGRGGHAAPWLAVTLAFPKEKGEQDRVGVVLDSGVINHNHSPRLHESLQLERHDDGTATVQFGRPEASRASRRTVPPTLAARRCSRL